MVYQDWLSVKISPGKAGIQISVPKKIVRLAVQRNRVKRLVREAVRLNHLFLDNKQKCTIRIHRLPKKLGLKDVEIVLKNAV